MADPFANEKKQTAREIFREMRTTTHSYAKNFAMIGAVFSTVECAIESVSLHHFDFGCLLNFWINLLKLL